MRYAVVDVETSGLSTRWHRVLQVAVINAETIESAAGTELTITDEWTSLIGTRWPWPRVGPRRVHGIGRHDLRGAPRLKPVMVELARRLQGATLVAHNLDFDLPFLERAARRAQVELHPADTLCTLKLSRRLDPERKLSHRLSDVAQRHGTINELPHDALHDARTTALILPHLLDLERAQTRDNTDAP